MDATARAICIYWYFIVSEGPAVSKERILLVLVCIYCHNGNKILIGFVLYILQSCSHTNPLFFCCVLTCYHPPINFSLLCVLIAGKV